MSKLKKPKPKVMVCVTRQRTCERLIRGGALMATKMGYELLVTHVAHRDENVLGSQDEAEALEMLFALTSEYGGEMVMIRCDDKLEGLAKCARKHNGKMIILGASPQHADAVVDALRPKLPDADFVVLEAQSDIEDLIA